MNWKIKTQNDNLKFNLKKIIRSLLANRGLKTKKGQEEFLNPTLRALKQKFFKQKDLKKALGRIKLAIKNKEKIIVYSDYDADGITGGAILWETLDEAGAKVFPYVPDRILEGYGLSTKGIDQIIKDHPDIKLIITVDHGITAVKQITYAKEKGIEVIITDHHAFPAKLPKALSIVHSLKLSGAGVAFLFSQKLRQILKMETKDDHLGLAAFGTIADLVPLSGANRVITKFGLEILSKTKKPGIKTLREVAGLTEKKLTPYDISFVLGPRINATGRLTHALDALRLLCTKDEARAKRLAAHLNSINQERQQMLTISTEQAKNSVEKDLPTLLFISHESYHEGVIGLVAGKLTETFYRPSIVIAKREKYSKASARSIAGFNMIEAIRKISDILVDCGGHPMAAGFTIETQYLERARERLLTIAQNEIKEEMLKKVLAIDAEIDLADISWELYREMEKFAPFGMGNNEPLFCTKSVRLVDAKLIGREKQHLKLLLETKSSPLEAVGFGMGELYSKLSPDKPINIAYSIFANRWNGEEKLQLKLKDIKS